MANPKILGIARSLGTVEGRMTAAAEGKLAEAWARKILQTLDTVDVKPKPGYFVHVAVARRTLACLAEDSHRPRSGGPMDDYRWCPSGNVYADSFRAESFRRWTKRTRIRKSPSWSWMTEEKYRPVIEQALQKMGEYGQCQRLPWGEAAQEFGVTTVSRVGLIEQDRPDGRRLLHWTSKTPEVTFDYKCMNE